MASNRANSAPARYFSVESLSRVLDVKPDTLRKWCREGRLEHVRLGDRLIRIPARAVAGLIREEPSGSRP
jgi:excisionase family DNA binding protein